MKNVDRWISAAVSLLFLLVANMIGMAVWSSDFEAGVGTRSFSDYYRGTTWLAPVVGIAIEVLHARMRPRSG